MGIKNIFGGAKIPPPPDDFHAIAKMLDAQTGISPLMQGYGNQAHTATGMQMMQAQQNAGIHNMLNHAQMMKVGLKDPKEMHFVMREIRNGYMVKVGDNEVYVKDLNDVGGVIVARWAAKILGE